MRNYEKFVTSILSFALFAIAVFITCVVYYLVQRKRIAIRNQNLPFNHRIDTSNLTPLSIVVTGSRELRNLK